MDIDRYFLLEISCTHGHTSFLTKQAPKSQHPLKTQLHIIGSNAKLRLCQRKLNTSIVVNETLFLNVNEILVRMYVRFYDRGHILGDDVGARPDVC